MQFRLLPAFVIFLGSYFPLAFILLVQDIPDRIWRSRLCIDFIGNEDCTLQVLGHPGWAIPSVILSLMALLVARYVLSKVTLRFDVVVEEVKPVPNDLINYAFPYIVSFMGLGFDSPSKLAGFMAFFILLFAITYRSGQIVMNPLLILFGWQLYEVTLRVNGSKKVARALKRGRLTTGAQKMEVVQDFVFLGDA